MTTVPPGPDQPEPKRKNRRRKDDGYRLRVESIAYEWQDANGVTHLTSESELPAQYRGPDGRPQLPDSHPAWKTVLDTFYEALNKQYLRADPAKPLSRDVYWLLWERERETMLDLYQQWLGAKA